MNKIVEHMGAQEYHSTPGVGSTALAAAHKSMAHYKAHCDGLTKPSRAMAFGSLCHDHLQGIGVVMAKYAVATDGLDLRTKAGKEFKAECEGKKLIVVDKEDYDSAQQAMKNVCAHPVAADLLRNAQHEVSVFWQSDDVDCKARYDIWRPDISAVIDLKTTKDASPDAFRSSIARYCYHLQAAHYLSPVDAQLFVWIAVESTAPFNCAVYTASANMIKQGSERVRSLLAQIATCRKSDKWPGYPTDPIQLDLPTWADESRGQNEV